MINYDVAEGNFIMFSDEIIMQIMSSLNAKDLASVARVNKKFKRLSEDDFVSNLPFCVTNCYHKFYFFHSHFFQLWEEICQFEGISKVPTSTYKKLYLQSCKFSVTTKFLFFLSFLGNTKFNLSLFNYGKKRNR